MKISRFVRVSGLIFFRDGVGGMIRNASCFITLFHVNNELHLLKEASKSNPLLVLYHFPNLSIKTSYSTYKMHTKRLTQCHPKAIPSGVKHDLFG